MTLDTREALKPFARIPLSHTDDIDDSATVFEYEGGAITLGDLRRVHEALTASPGEQKPQARLREALEAARKAIARVPASMIDDVPYDEYYALLQQIDTALSNPPAAVESNTSVEARLREALDRRARGKGHERRMAFRHQSRLRGSMNARRAQSEDASRKRGE